MRVDYQKISAWLSERWKAPASCPICKKNSWNLSDTAYELHELSRPDSPDAGETAIVVPVTCGVCGHVLLFDARRLGVV